jgi:hypothetical protein
VKRFIIVTALAAWLGGAMALHHERKRAEEAQRRIATEEACRAIVEAGLVRSCTVNSLHSKQK